MESRKDGHFFLTSLSWGAAYSYLFNSLGYVIGDFIFALHPNAGPDAASITYSLLGFQGVIYGLISYFKVKIMDEAPKYPHRRAEISNTISNGCYLLQGIFYSWPNHPYTRIAWSFGILAFIVAAYSAALGFKAYLQDLQEEKALQPPQLTEHQLSRLIIHPTLPAPIRNDNDTFSKSCMSQLRQAFTMGALKDPSFWVAILNILACCSYFIGGMVAITLCDEEWSDLYIWFAKGRIFGDILWLVAPLVVVIDLHKTTRFKIVH